MMILEKARPMRADKAALLKIRKSRTKEWVLFSIRLQFRKNPMN